MIINDIIGLRAIEKEDLNKLKNWRNSPELRRYFREWRELNEFDQQTWFNNICCGNDKYNMYAICSMYDSPERSVFQNQMIGVCGLTSINWINKFAEISLYIGVNNLYVDKLFAPNALDLLITIAFNTLNLNKVWAEVFTFDKLKQNLLENCKFVKEGVLRDNHFEQGQYFDSNIYSMLKEEFIKYSINN